MYKILILAALTVSTMIAQASTVTLTGPMQLEISTEVVKSCNTVFLELYQDESTGVYAISQSTTVIGCPSSENPFNLKETVSRVMDLEAGESVEIKASSLARYDIKVSSEEAVGNDAGIVSFNGPIQFALSYDRRKNCNEPVFIGIELDNGADVIIAGETEVYCGILDNPFGFKSKVTATYTVPGKGSYKVSAISFEGFKLEIKKSEQ